jgi:transglutaminase-like putative cysteine protease
LIGDALKLSRYHEIGLYAAVLFSFLAVASNGAGIIVGALFVASLPLSWYVHRRGWTARVPQGVWNGLILLAIAGTGARMFLSEDSLLSSGIQFILVLVMLKLFARQGARDDWQIYALTFLVMAAGTAVNEDIAYGAVFALYVLTTTFGLTLFHLKSEVDLNRTNTRASLGRGYVGALGALAVAVFASSVFLFFALPRVGLGFFATKDRAPTSMTGFNDEVQLGSHGAIRSNPEVVMRVTFPEGQRPAQHDYEGYHWRVMGFDTYDGTSWSRSRPKGDVTMTRPVDRDDRQVRDLTVLYPELKKEKGGALEVDGLPHEIYLEPLGTDQVPVLTPVHSLQLANSLNIPFSPRYTIALTDAHYGDVLLRSRNDLGTSYTIWPAEGRREFPSADPEARIPRSYDVYLQLPPGLERLVALSKQIADPIPEPSDKAEAIVRYLGANYSYTLNLPPVDPSNPVESFLFDTKQGHCEYFATSFVLMMRAAGVRARVVNGFLGGTWNDVGDYMVVRQGDAHAWAEVYIPGRGWITFDPTPSSEASMRLSPDVGPIRLLRNTYDSMRMTWMKWVIEYDLDSQIQAARDLSRALTPKSNPFGGDSGGDAGQEDQPEKTNIPTRLILLFGGWLFVCVVAWNLGRLTRPRAVAVTAAAAGACALAGGAWVGWFYAFEATSVAGGAAPPLALGLLARAFGSDWSRSGSRSNATKLFARIERAAARVGVEREEDEGADLFLRRLARLYPEAREDLDLIRARYLRARHGGQPLNASERAELRRRIDKASSIMSSS